MAALLMVLWAGVLVVLFIAVLTAPRWCLRSLARHRLWELRDKLMDDVLDRRLDRDDKQVVHLLGRIENAISHVTNMTLLELLVFARLYDRSGLEVPAATEYRADLLRRREDRFRYLLMSSLFLGSWIGIGLTSLSYLRLRLQRGSRGVKRAAVERAAGTWLGRRTSRGAFLASNCHSPA